MEDKDKTGVRVGLFVPKPSLSVRVTRRVLVVSLILGGLAFPLWGVVSPYIDGSAVLSGSPTEDHDDQ